MKQEKLTSWDDLKRYRAEIANKMSQTANETLIAVGMATCGEAAGAKAVMEALGDEIKAKGVKHVKVVPTGCFGFCYAEPMLEVRSPGQPGIKYGYVDDKIARVIIRKHIIDGELLDNAILGQEVQKP